MKILMLGWELPPYNSGGLGVACYQMCKHLALNGVEIDFVVPYIADHKQSFMTVHGATRMTSQEFMNVAGAYDSYCYTCNDISCEHVGVQDLRGRQRRYVKFVENLVKDNYYDVIHAHDWLTFEAGMRARTLTGRPLIAHVHATEFDRSGENQGNPLVHEIEYNGLLMADHIIAVSKITKDLIVKNYQIPESKIEVVHNSIDKDDFEALSDSTSFIYLEEMKKRGYKVVVSVGRLTVQKGFRYLLEAARLVHNINNKILFVIAGSGELRNELIQLAADLGIAENIIFTGFIRGKQWRDAYAIGDMFVMSSVSEPFGLTALEAAGYGNAILVSKQSGVSEVLHNTLRFDFWDTQRLANQIISIAEESNLQNALSTNASNEFLNMSWQKAAQKFINIYESAKKEMVTV